MGMFRAKVPATGSCVIIVLCAQGAQRLCTKPISVLKTMKVIIHTGLTATNATQNSVIQINLNCSNGTYFALRSIATTRFAANARNHLIIPTASQCLLTQQ